MATARSSAAAWEASEESWRGNLWNYAYGASKGEWVPFAALRFIADIVQEAIRRGGGRIIINIPPRHGKSSLISKWLPTWFLDWHPTKRVLLTSYGDPLASDWSSKVRDEFRYNPLTWASVRRDKEGKNDWELTQGGGMRAAGVGGPIIGFGADLAIIDDPHKNREEAFSATQRKKITDWFDATLYTRLEPGATVVLIMQRWHEEDLTGYLLNEHEDDWLHIKLPAIAEEEDLLGRTEGQALIPERYNEETLKQIERAVGSIVWAGMYQQRPAPAEGNIVLRDWFNFYKRYPEDIARVVNSWDMSFKKEGKSWCVGQCWYQKGSRHYLLAQERGKWDFTTALKKVVAFHNHTTERWKHVRETLIEEAANGYAIIQSVKGRMPRVKAIRASKSKLERMSNAAPSIECGDVWLPDKSIAGFDVDGLVEEVVTFPNGPDDQCDTLSQYINRYKTQKMGAIKMNLDVGLGSPEWRLQ